MNSTPQRLLVQLAGALVLSGAAFAQGSNNCSGAQSISGEGVYNFNNASATQDGQGAGLCNAFGTDQIDNDVWFAWTSNVNGSVTVSTCGGTGVDTKIAAYAGTACPTGAPLACNDDTCGLQSQISFDANNGSTYLLRIGTFPGAAGGSGTFEVSAGGGGGGGCTNPAPGADVIVGDLNGISNYSSVGGIAAYSIGTTSCNNGSEELLWISNNNQHPVIGQNIFRIEDGRIEQIGQGWLKHGFFALSENLCCTCTPTGGSTLGVGCSDPYGSGLNGQQGGLGPRSDINPFTGGFSYPFTTQGQTGNSIYKRIQVANNDLDPGLHSGAIIIGDGQYVTPDDSAAGNGDNNVSWRRLNVGNFSGGRWNLSFTGATQREETAMDAWQNFEPNVLLDEVAAANDGIFVVGSNAIDMGGGMWRYEYAVYNQISDRAARSFSVPVPSGTSVTNLFFNDVSSHSGEPYSNADWTSSVAGGSVTWSTQTFGQNQNANAIRWGTLYSFGFTANAAPVAANATLGLFKSGTGGDNLLPQIQAPDDAGGCVGGVSNYCVTSPNSIGAGSTISATGSTSIAANNFNLVASEGPAGQFGLFYYGAGQTNAPFGDGVRCVGAGGVGTFRLNPATTIDGLGQVIRNVDFTNPPSAPGTITAGSTWNFQFWYRDPAAGGSGFNLSDALEATFCP